MLNIPEPILPFIEALKEETSIQAVVLGGSRARGSHLTGSDVDLGLYYEANLPLDTSALDDLVSKWDDRRQASLVTPIGGWGPNINGGGWLRIHGIPVDLIYRDLAVVGRVVKDSLEGRLQVTYQPGHPFGFLSSIHAAEIALCQPVWERQNQISSLKTQIIEYPPALKKAMLQKFAWEIRFSIQIAERAIERQDLAYIAGCLFRSVECMCLVIFALNRQHWMNEKGAAALASEMKIVPRHFNARVKALFTAIGNGETGLREAVSAADQLCNEVNDLAGDNLN